MPIRTPNPPSIVRWTRLISALKAASSGSGGVRHCNPSTETEDHADQGRHYAKHADEQREEETIKSLIDRSEAITELGAQLSDIRVGRHFVWIESGQLPHQLLRTVGSEYVGKTSVEICALCLSDRHSLSMPIP